MPSTFSQKLPEVTKSSVLRKKSVYFTVLKWLLIIAAILAIIYLGTLPVRGKLVKKHIQSGNNLLIQKRYLAASLEYEKALMLKPNSDEARAGQQLADTSAKDILVLADLLGKDNRQEELELFQSAQSVPKSETEAVRKAKNLIEKGEYQLAILPAKTAIQMDKSYRDAWLYLGIANLKCAQFLEIKNNIRLEYLNDAKTAFEKAEELDPSYEPILGFLKALKGKS